MFQNQNVCVSDVSAVGTLPLSHTHTGTQRFGIAVGRQGKVDDIDLTWYSIQELQYYSLHTHVHNMIPERQRDIDRLIDGDTKIGRGDKEMKWEAETKEIEMLWPVSQFKNYAVMKILSFTHPNVFSNQTKQKCPGCFVHNNESQKGFWHLK